MEPFVLVKEKYIYQQTIQVLQSHCIQNPNEQMRVIQHQACKVINNIRYLLNKTGMPNITKEPNQADFKTRLLLLSDSFKDQRTTINRKLTTRTQGCTEK